jgi:hypothetical protein
MPLATVHIAPTLSMMYDAPGMVVPSAEVPPRRGSFDANQFEPFHQ